MLQYLEENRTLITIILEHQNQGKLEACAQYVTAPTPQATCLPSLPSFISCVHTHMRLLS